MNDRTRTILTLIPAHAEEHTVAAAIASVAPQVDRVVVVSDNSPDRTPEVAAAAGAEVFRTVGNTHKKAGALNQALRTYLPHLHDDDLIFVLDADTTISPNFMTTALPLFAQPDIGAVGGVFEGEAATTWLSQLNRNEFARYTRQIDRTRRTMVLSGTSSLIRVSVIREVMEARGTRLPGTYGHVYDLGSITEDNELSIAIRTIGYRLASPVECSVVTELMPTIPDLHRQRVRWYRGALDNLRTYGLTKVTARYWFQQSMLLWGLAMFVLLAVLTVVAVASGMWGITTIGAAVTLTFAASAVVTVWHSRTPDGGRDWRGIAYAVPLLPEIFYNYLLFAAFAHAAVASLRRTEATWSHVTTTPTN